MRLLSYNLHCGVGTDGRYDLERIGSVLAQKKPDVVCLQEVEHNWPREEGLPSWRARHFSAAHSDDQVAKLSQLSDLPHTAYCASFQAHVEEERTASSGEEVLVRSEHTATWGNGILSRWPIREQKVLRFVPLEADPSEAEEGILFPDRQEQPRTALAAKIEVPADDGSSDPVTMWLVNTHFSHRQFSAEQQGQAQQVLEWLERPGEFDAPAVLVGDLNSWQGQPMSGYSVLMSSGRFVDAFGSGFGIGWSSASTTIDVPFWMGGAIGLRARIDHILLPEGSSCEASSALVVCDSEDDRVASDHTAVQAELVFSAAKPAGQ